MKVDRAGAVSPQNNHGNVGHARYYPTMKASEAIGYENSRLVLDELLSDWAEFSEVDDFHPQRDRRGKPLDGRDVSLIAAIIGLGNHAYDTARAAATLLDDGQLNASLLLVRTVYETALTAVWLVQAKDHQGITAFLHEYARGRGALQRDARSAASKVFREGAEGLPDADPSLYEDKLDSMRNFQQVCEDLHPGGIDAYILYRILSGYSHPSAAIVDLYIDQHTDGSPVKRQQAKPALEPDLLCFTLSAALVWAGRAFSYLSKSKAHRSALRSAARKLGIPAEIQLSERYLMRHATAGKRS